MGGQALRAREKVMEVIGDVIEVLVQVKPWKNNCLNTISGEGLIYMKILFFGAGVIGITYAWQISKFGHEVHVLVRKNKKKILSEEGFQITCMDLRHGKPKILHTTFKPKIMDDIVTETFYDLIVVSVNSHQLDSVLPILKEKAGKTDIMFLLNTWCGEVLIEKYLKSSHYFFGFPFKAGGGRSGQYNNIIDTVIFGEILSETVIGEKDGIISERVKRIAHVMKQADMKPKVTKKIIPYLRTHYIWAASSLGAYMKAGTFERFATDSKVLKEYYLAMREGFEICKSQGINPKKVSPAKLFYLPLFLLIPYTRKSYNSESMKRMFEGHIQHSPDEMKVMYYDVLKAGEQYGIDMPYFKGFKKHVDNYLKHIQK